MRKKFRARAGAEIFYKLGLLGAGTAKKRSAPQHLGEGANRQRFIDSQSLS
jgi:hypothetical protein